MREKFPLGIAQVGTVLRNEISPRQGPIRLREFTIMDFELFFDPEKPECPYIYELKEDKIHIITEKTRRKEKTKPPESQLQTLSRNDSSNPRGWHTSWLSRHGSWQS